MPSVHVDKSERYFGTHHAMEKSLHSMEVGRWVKSNGDRSDLRWSRTF